MRYYLRATALGWWEVFVVGLLLWWMWSTFNVEVEVQYYFLRKLLRWNCDLIYNYVEDFHFLLWCMGCWSLHVLLYIVVVLILLLGMWFIYSRAWFLVQLMSFMQNVGIFWFHCLVTWNFIFVDSNLITFNIRYSNYFIVR